MNRLISLVRYAVVGFMFVAMTATVSAQSKPSPWKVNPLNDYVPPSPWQTPGGVNPFAKPATGGLYLPEPPALWSKPAFSLVIGGFDWSKSPDERQKLIALEKKFPNLGLDFEVVAPSTKHPDETGTKYGTYNCIAWSVGITTEWVWPGKKVKDFDKLYGQHGYRRQDTRDTKVEAGFEKVALYGKVTPAGELEATHAARQEADGTWTSKVGALARIKHRTADSVAGPSYGDPIAVYVRKK